MITMSLILNEEFDCLLQHQCVSNRLQDPSNEGIKFVQFSTDVEKVIETEL